MFIFISQLTLLIQILNQIRVDGLMGLLFVSVKPGVDPGFFSGSAFFQKKKKKENALTARAKCVGRATREKLFSYQVQKIMEKIHYRKYKLVRFTVMKQCKIKIIFSHV